MRVQAHEQGLFEGEEGFARRNIATRHTGAVRRHRN